MDLTLTEGGRGATQALLLAHNNDSKGMQVVKLKDDAIVERGGLENGGQRFLLLVSDATARQMQSASFLIFQHVPPPCCWW